MDEEQQFEELTIGSFISPYGYQSTLFRAIKESIGKGGNVKGTIKWTETIVENLCDQTPVDESWPWSQNFVIESLGVVRLSILPEKRSLRLQVVQQAAKSIRKGQWPFCFFQNADRDDGRPTKVLIADLDLDHPRDQIERAEIITNWTGEKEDSLLLRLNIKGTIDCGTSGYWGLIYQGLYIWSLREGSIRRVVDHIYDKFQTGNLYRLGTETTFQLRSDDKDPARSDFMREPSVDITTHRSEIKTNNGDRDYAYTYEQEWIDLTFESLEIIAGSEIALLKSSSRVTAINLRSGLIAASISDPRPSIKCNVRRQSNKSFIIWFCIPTVTNEDEYEYVIDSSDPGYRVDEEEASYVVFNLLVDNSSQVILALLSIGNEEDDQAINIEKLDQKFIDSIDILSPYQPEAFYPIESTTIERILQKKNICIDDIILTSLDTSVILPSPQLEAQLLKKAINGESALSLNSEDYTWTSSIVFSLEFQRDCGRMVEIFKITDNGHNFYLYRQVEEYSFKSMKLQGKLHKGEASLLPFGRNGRRIGRGYYALDKGNGAILFVKPVYRLK